MSLINQNDIPFMHLALAEAQKAAAEEEIPIGAILVEKDQIIARAHNTRETSKNPLHHAEMVLLETTGKQKGDWRLSETTLYVTVEPCLMCLGALLQSRVERLVFGCHDPKRKPAHLFEGGGVDLTFPSLSQSGSLTANNHTLKITGGILEEECSQILRRFFEQRR